jgi:flagellar basal-body rod protein FlgG
MDGLYQALSGAMALEQRLQVSANDLANLNTTGYKRTRLTTGSEYPTIQADLIHTSDPSGLDTAAPDSVPSGERIFTGISEQQIDWAQGQLRMTGSPTDLAFDGRGFFPVDVNGEELYTRAGAFELSSEGTLVMRAGDQWAPVLTEAGPVTLPSIDFSVASDGTIRDADGTTLGRLRVVDFADPQALEMRGFTLFANREDAAGITELPAEDRSVVQGGLEQANSNPITSLVEMIELQRTYQALAEAMRTIDQATDRRISSAMQ